MKYKDFKTMSQNEMKQIKGGNVPVGGGSCAFYQPHGNASGGPVVTYGVSAADAQAGAAGAAGGGGHWCCDSCASASWYGI